MGTSVSYIHIGFDIELHESVKGKRVKMNAKRILGLSDDMSKMSKKRTEYFPNAQCNPLLHRAETVGRHAYHKGFITAW